MKIDTFEYAAYFASAEVYHDQADIFLDSCKQAFKRGLAAEGYEFSEDDIKVTTSIQPDRDYMLLALGSITAMKG